MDRCLDPRCDRVAHKNRLVSHPDTCMCGQACWTRPPREGEANVEPEYGVSVRRVCVYDCECEFSSGCGDDCRCVVFV